LVEKRQTTHRQIDGVGIPWPIVQAPSGFGVHQLDLKRAGEAHDHFVLEFEQVRDVVFESIRPDLRIGFRLDQLRVDEHPVLIALHRAFAIETGTNDAGNSGGGTPKCSMKTMTIRSHGALLRTTNTIQWIRTAIRRFLTKPRRAFAAAEDSGLVVG
jgi:hypothetical protein